MPKVITKVVPKKAAPAAVKQEVNTSDALPELDQMSLEQLVDEYGGLKDKCDAIMQDPAFAKLALVTEEMKNRLAKYEPEEIIKVLTGKWAFEAGACALAPSKVTDIQQAYEFLGHEAFMQIAKINVGDAEKYLTPDQTQHCISGAGFTQNRKWDLKYVGPASKK